jgi:Zn-dependent protease with chaperone function
MMEAPVDARLFGGGAPATGEHARITLVSGQLEVQWAGGRQRVPLTLLRVREVVSAYRGIEFSWDSRGVQYAVQVFDPQSLQQLRAHSSLMDLPQMSSLHAARRRGRIAWTLGWSLLAAIVLLPLLLLLLLVWQADRIVGAVAERIPVAREEQLGRHVFEGMRSKLALKESGDEVRLVRELGARLSQGSRFHYEFHVATNPAVNAFALPGGIIVVHTGLIAATRRPEELAGVLAHEIQHVEQRHSVEALLKELGLRGIWAVASGDVGGTLAGHAAVELMSRRFSRDAEAEADAAGFELLVRNGIDPQGMADFFGTLAASTGPAMPAWLSTHPASEARRLALEAKLDELEQRDFAPLRLQTSIEVSAGSAPAP